MSGRTYSLPADPFGNLKAICNSLGIAGVLVGFAWVLQACGFNAGAGTEALWAMMGAVIAGSGAGFLLVAHADVI